MSLISKSARVLANHRRNSSPGSTRNNWITSRFSEVRPSDVIDKISEVLVVFPNDLFFGEGLDDSPAMLLQKILSLLKKATTEQLRKFSAHARFP